MSTDQKQDRRRDDPRLHVIEEKLERLVTFAETYEEFLRLAVIAEKARHELRSAVIQKSFLGMVWAGLVVLGLSLWDYIKAHIK